MTIELLRFSRESSVTPCVQADAVSPRVIPCDDRDSSKEARRWQSTRYSLGSMLSLADKENCGTLRRLWPLLTVPLGGFSSGSC